MHIPAPPSKPAMTAAGAIGVVQRDGAVLLALSRDRGWEPPGGYCEEGEYVVDALRREVLEETGYVVSPSRLTGVYQCVREHPILSFVFLCKVEKRVERPLDESLAIRWCSPRVIPTLVTYMPHRLRLRDALGTPGLLYIRRYTIEPFSVNDTTVYDA